MQQNKTRHVRQIVALAWPILVGQLALIAYGVADTMMVARYSAADLAAMALGGSIYISIFLGLSGILLALSPKIAHAFGAQQLPQIGALARQGVWLALGLAALGSLLLAFPAPLLALAKAEPALEAKALSYLRLLALALPATLCFTVYASLNNGLGRPKMVMLLQVWGLSLKILLNAWLIHGGLGVPALGGPGCALATVLVGWSNLLLGFMLLKRKREYRHFGLFGQGFSAPHWPTLRSLLAVGLPIGGGYFIEVTSFTFMAIFITRLGESALAAHQITANIGAVMYMLPLSIAQATSTLVAQARGAQQPAQVYAVTRSGLRTAVLAAVLLGVLAWLLRTQIATLYTQDAQVLQRILPLFVFLGAYQFFDALQTTIAYVMRAYQIVVVPMLINAFALWGVGLFGGCLLGLNPFGWALPTIASGVSGFWLANSSSLVLLAATLFLYLRHVEKQSGTRAAYAQTRV